MASFAWEDPLLLEDQLSEEERQIRDAANEFAQGELAPLILDWNRTETFDPEIMKEMGKLGFLGATLPDYGCAGISNVSYGLIAREMERVDTCFRSAMGVQSAKLGRVVSGTGKSVDGEAVGSRQGETKGSRPRGGAGSSGNQTRSGASIFFQPSASGRLVSRLGGAKTQ